MVQLPEGGKKCLNQEVQPGQTNQRGFETRGKGGLLSRSRSLGEATGGISTGRKEKLAMEGQRKSAVSSCSKRSQNMDGGRK